MRTDAGVPPHPFSLTAIFRQQDLKSTLPVIARLVPGALPEPIRVFGRHKTSIVLGIGAVSLFIQRRDVALVVLDLEDDPFATQVRRRGYPRDMSR